MSKKINEKGETTLDLCDVLFIFFIVHPVMVTINEKETSYEHC